MDETKSVSFHQSTSDPLMDDLYNACAPNQVTNHAGAFKDSPRDFLLLRDICFCFF